MKDIIILGAGGGGREIAWLIEEINDTNRQWNILGYLDSHPNVQNTEVIGYPVLGKFEDHQKYKEAYFTVAFGDPLYRKEVALLIDGPGIKWATLVSPTVRLHSSNKIGKGVIIGRNSDLTVECIIHDFVWINIHVVLGHKVEVGAYSFLCPNVMLNGGSKVGKCCNIGANAFIRDVEIGDRVVVGANSSVVKPFGSDCVIAGVPAKVIRKGVPKHSVTKSLRDQL